MQLMNPLGDRPKLVRLSDELVRLDLAQQSDKFVAELRQAVRDQVIEACYVEGRCELPKKFRYKSSTPDERKRRRAGENSDGTYNKRTPEMLILVSDAYLQWFDDVRLRLSQVEYPELRPENHHRATAHPSAAAMMADPTLSLFRRNVEVTRQRLLKQQAHGRSLATKKGFSKTEEESGIQTHTETSPHTERPSTRASRKSKKPKATSPEVTP